ncbi:MAG: sulfotransferase [Sphingomonadales bacterium]|nr:sulfotransferase [Sphingomonadales bacterium]
MDEIARLKQAMTLEPLLDAAFAEAGTGAREFRDTSFLPNLEKTLEIPTRLPMSARGLMGVHANFVRFLVNRLRWEADVAKHPEILDEDVSDPIVVLGLPRSGTTKLQRFLSADPNVQATPAWAMFNPAPFPGEAPGDPSARIDWANRMMASVTNTGETYQIMHEFGAREADETSFIPLANFDNVMQFITTPDYTYLEWVRSVSRVPSQAYLREMLKYLQWQGGGRKGRPWVLKNPGNTGEFLEMLEVFPKATFVISRRDRLRVQALRPAAPGDGRRGPAARDRLRPLRQRRHRRGAGALRTARPALDARRRGGDAPVGQGQPAAQARLLRLQPRGLRLERGKDRAGSRAGRARMAREIGERAMFLHGHMQNAYVTHDLDKAMEIVADRFGVEKFDRFDPDMVVNTPEGPQPMVNRVASYWAGGLNIEIIEPVSGYIGHYLSMLPADRTDAVPRFHHISLRRDDEAAMPGKVYAKRGVKLCATTWSKRCFPAFA